MPTPEEGRATTEKTFISESESNVKFHTYHMERTVNIYSIQESELRSIFMLNTLVLAAASIGTGLFTYIIGLATDAAMQESITITGQILLNVVVPICTVLGLGCFGVAYWAYRSKKSELDRILEESRGKN